MKQVKVTLYREKDGSYSCYADDIDDLEYGLTGEGATAREAIADWESHYRAMQQYHDEQGRSFTEARFTYAYDVPSMLNYYGDRFTFAGLSRITGISAAQLSQYANGYRNPSTKTAGKIQNALHTFGSELCELTLV